MVIGDTVISFRKPYQLLNTYYVVCWIRSAYKEIKEAGVYIYIYIYIYVCVCVFVCVCVCVY